MRIFDPHAHMTSRTTDDYEAMAASGVKALVEPAFWLGQPRTSAGLVRRLLQLAARLGALPRRRSSASATTARSGSTRRRPTTTALRREVLDLLPRFLAKDGVVAVGEIGFDAMTPAEDEAFARAARAGGRARAAGAGAHAAPRQGWRARGARSSWSRQSGLDARAWSSIDHNNELTVDRGARLRLLGGLLDLPGHEDGRVPDGAHPRGARPRADAGQLGLRLGRLRPAEGRARRSRRCRRPASTTTTIDRVVWRNPVEFFGQSGRLILDDLGERDLDGDVRGQHGAARGARMRLRHPDGSLLHLAYCSNVHPADDLDGVAAQLERYAARGARARSDVPVLGVGLWVAAPALRRRGRGATGCAAQLDRLGLEVVTLNGFPYTAFHAPVVKRDVYRPHWADAARRDYTLGLAPAARRLLPGRRRRRAASRRCRSAGARAGATRSTPARRGARSSRSPTGSRDCEASTGRRIRLALEPEPGCAIETVAQACGLPRRPRARLDRRLPRRLPPRGPVRGRRTARSRACRRRACRW